jgi:hypothetical protein
MPVRLTARVIMVAKLPTLSGRIQMHLEDVNAGVVKGPMPKTEDEKIGLKVAEGITQALAMQGYPSPETYRNPPVTLFISEQDYLELGSPAVGHVLTIDLDRDAK